MTCPVGSYRPDQHCFEPTLYAPGCGERDQQLIAERPPFRGDPGRACSARIGGHQTAAHRGGRNAQRIERQSQFGGYLASSAAFGHRRELAVVDVETVLRQHHRRHAGAIESAGQQQQPLHDPGEFWIADQILPYKAVERSLTTTAPVPRAIVQACSSGCSANPTTGIPARVAQPTSNKVPASAPSSTAKTLRHPRKPSRSFSATSSPPQPISSSGENTSAPRCVRAPLVVRMSCL